MFLCDNSNRSIYLIAAIITLHVSRNHFNKKAHFKFLSKSR